MKTILTLFLAFTAAAGWAQTHADTIKMYTLDNKTGMWKTLSSNHIDTVKCYFLKAPAVFEFPLQPIGAQWFLGYSVSKYNEAKCHYLYLDKSPVNEQVLISIAKE